MTQPEYHSTPSPKAKQKRCIGWVADANGILVQCPEPVPPDRDKYHDKKCAQRTWYWIDRGFELGDKRRPSDLARKVRRLTAVEEPLMERRLRELCTAGMPGTEIRVTLNREFNIEPPWTLQAYFQRAERLNLPWTYTRRWGRSLASEYLSEDQRAACYEDPAYEARHGIADRVICRECFAILRDGAMHGMRGHRFTIHKMKKHQYTLRNPGAPIFTFQRIAEQQGRDVGELMAEEREQYCTPEERKAADADPDYEKNNGITKYVVCRVPRCGFKSVMSLNNHLRKRHDKTVLQYHREHKLPAIMSAEALKRVAEAQAKAKAEAAADQVKAAAAQLKAAHLLAGLGRKRGRETSTEVFQLFQEMMLPRAQALLEAIVTLAPKVRRDPEQLRSALRGFSEKEIDAYSAYSDRTCSEGPARAPQALALRFVAIARKESLELVRKHVTIYRRMQKQQARAPAV